MSKIKNISILCGSFPPETGAAPGRIFLMAKLLQEYGYLVQVITAMPNYPTGRIFPEYQGKWQHSEIWEGIPVTRLWLVPTNSSSKIRRAFSLGSLSASLNLQLPNLLSAQNPDLLIISSPPLLLGSIGSRIARYMRIPVLLNISDLWPSSAQELGFLREGIVLRYLRHKEDRMYRSAAAFSVQSEEIAEHIRNYCPNKPIFIYRNLQVQSPYATRKRPPGKRKVVYAGLLGIAQGVAAIAEQIDFAALGTELHIYGAGNEQNKIRALSASRTDIVYHGNVPASAIPEVLSQYHIMLVPLAAKIIGAVPSKIFNAIANGLPLLYMGSGESARIVAHHELGYTCSPGDMAALKRNLEQMLHMREDAFTQLRERCLHAAEYTFCKTKQDEAFLEFLRKLEI